MIPVGVGYWLDRPEMFDKRPLFTLIGLGFGTIVAFFGLFRMLFRYQAEQEKFRENKEWWNRKKSKKANDRHSGVSRNPVISSSYENTGSR